MSSLRASAKEFEPRGGWTSSPAVDIPNLPDDLYDDGNNLTGLEMSVSPADLEELETVEAWVVQMAELEAAEQDHCIEMAMRFADKKQIQEIQARMAAAKISSNKSSKAGGPQARRA